MRLSLLALCYLGVLATVSGLAAAHGPYTCVSDVCAYVEPMGTHHNPHTYVDSYGPTGGLVHFYFRHDIHFMCVAAGGLPGQCVDLP